MVVVVVGCTVWKLMKLLLTCPIHPLTHTLTHSLDLSLHSAAFADGSTTSATPNGGSSTAILPPPAPFKIFGLRSLLTSQKQV